MSLLYFLLIGICAGWLAGQLHKGRGFGLTTNLVIGIIGALIGGFLLGQLGVFVSGLIGTLISATIGAVVLLVILKFLREDRSGVL